MTATEILQNLVDIKKNAQKFHSAQIILVRLNRLSARSDYTKHIFHEAKINNGVESRIEAIKNQAQGITLCMNEINHDTNSQNTMKEIRHFQNLLNVLVNDYAGASSQYVAYNLKNKNLYTKVPYQLASKILDTVTKEITSLARTVKGKPNELDDF